MAFGLQGRVYAREGQSHRFAPLARRDSNVVTDAYGYYPGGDQPISLQLPSGRTGVFITDPQLRGTVRAMADADKNATNPEFKTYAVSPWGEVAADTGSITRLRMAGQPYDQDSRLYYMGARYYDRELGRFLAEDPIGVSGGLNLYRYAGNGPINRWDPTGAKPGDKCNLRNGATGVEDEEGHCIFHLPDLIVNSEPDLSGGSYPLDFLEYPGGKLAYFGFTAQTVWPVGLTAALGFWSKDWDSGFYCTVGPAGGSDVAVGVEGGAGPASTFFGGAKQLCVGAVALNYCNSRGAGKPVHSFGLSVGPSEAVINGHYAEKYTAAFWTHRTDPNLPKWAACFSASTGLGPYCR